MLPKDTAAASNGLGCWTSGRTRRATAKPCATPSLCARRTDTRSEDEGGGQERVDRAGREPKQAPETRARPLLVAARGRERTTEPARGRANPLGESPAHGMAEEGAARHDPHAERPADTT